ncbi:MAG: Glu/Leu/Phe/Val dehydrogenase [Magnetovibrio sp.]|nr:Glu/Leu/Phe/Val dehydrogenase [Magnetovibrio sp.]
MRSNAILSWSDRTDHICAGNNSTLEIVDVTAQAAELGAFDDHMVVLRGTSSATGLDAFIALHDTTLGPALGGCRVWKYARSEDALEDVLRLSTGMSYKAAMAGLPLGGGKAVINCDPHTGKTDALLRSFGAMVDVFDGAYITAEDVGTTVADMEVISQATPHALGRSGDPSPSTARGVMIGMLATLAQRLNATSFSGVTIAVQGLGKVGMSLCEQSHNAGARLVVADLDPDLVNHAVENYGARAVSPDKIMTTFADIFAPCALGGVITEQSVPLIKACIVAGSANNQLMTGIDGRRLHHAGILYAPDYVLNSGGLIDAYLQMPRGPDALSLSQYLVNIGETLNQIFQVSAQDNTPTNEIADRLAREKINNVHRDTGSSGPQFVGVKS